MTISFQSLHGKITISSSEIFKFILTSELVKFHYVFFFPLCIALKYQMPEKPEQSGSINLFLDWHKEENLILFSHWHSWYSHWQLFSTKRKIIVTTLCHISIKDTHQLYIITGENLPQGGTVELHFLSIWSEAIYFCFHITMQLYPWESTGQQECFPSFSFIECLPSLH